MEVTQMGLYHSAWSQKPVQVLGVMLGNLDGGAGKLAYVWPKIEHSPAKCEFALAG
jgi:hypothetical protein